MEVSLKVLKNKAYKISPVYRKSPSKDYKVEDLLGIRLLYSKSLENVWEFNGGVITMDKLKDDSKRYVLGLFTNLKNLNVFEGLGD